jgi:hypothetical protein
MPTIPPPPGELVDVGGHRVHLQRQGRGTPPVVLDAALGDGSLSWALVHRGSHPSQPSTATTEPGWRGAIPGRTRGRPPPWSPNCNDLLRAAAVELPIVLAALSDVTLTEADTPRPRQVRLRDGVRQGTSHRHHHVAA